MAIKEAFIAQKKKLGEILVESGLLTEEQLLKSLERQKKTGKKLGEILVDLKITTEVEIARTLGSQLGYQYVETITSIDQEVLSVISESLIKKYQVVPLRLQEQNLTIAMANPLDFDIIKDLNFYSGFMIHPAIATPTLLSETIKKFFGGVSELSDQEIVKQIIQDSQKDFNESLVQIIPEIKENGKGKDSLVEERHRLAPIVQMANLIIAKALKLRASDIHIEPFSNESVVRYRIDGLLQVDLKFPKWIHGALISRIKVLANLDIAEKRTPQDGDIRVKAEGREVTLRISTLPSYFGEKVVVRILDQASDLFQINALGLLSEDQVKIREMLSHRKGIILVTGPTGSGKTTTLYAMLTHIKHSSTNIITVENPIEYHMDGVTQIQINPDTGLTFSTALRAILRQDPNIILIGEIRDSETAQIAFRAALTGHLVISTLHTNDTPSAVIRLLDLGIPKYMVASLLIGVIAQKLVRVICPRCKTRVLPAEEEVKSLNIFSKTIDFHFNQGKGCKECYQTGFKGRTSVYEILPFQTKIKEIISQNPTEQQFKNACKDAGLATLIENGLQKVKAGVTTLGELIRVIGIDEKSGTMCGGCNYLLREEFNLCPICGAKQRDRCSHCNVKIQPHWIYCPYCENKLKKLDP